MIAIPAAFAAGIIAEAGEAGRAWLDRLPGLVESLCQHWGLELDGAPRHGYLGLVVLARRGGQPCALKVCWQVRAAAGGPSSDHENTVAHEAAALTAWGGRGAVELLAAEPELGALLLERLDGRRSLDDLDIAEAVAVAGGLLRRLAVPAPGSLPRLTALAERLSRSLPERWERLGRPLPRALVAAAADLAGQLGPAAGSLLANYDLHYGNVLAGEREPWLAIDPKVVAGDPEFALAQLLWTRLEDMEDIGREGGVGHHFRSLVERAELDLALTRAWTLVRCVDYWLWALGAGLTVDPARCARLCAQREVVATPVG